MLLLRTPVGECERAAQSVTGPALGHSGWGRTDKAAYRIQPNPCASTHTICMRYYATVLLNCATVVLAVWPASTQVRTEVCPFSGVPFQPGGVERAVPSRLAG